MPVYYNEAVDGPATYFQSSVSGQVIGVICGYKPMFFYHKSDNCRKELFDINVDLSEQKYVEIVPPKFDDVIYLSRNNINPNSPHVKKHFKVVGVDDFLIFLDSTEDGTKIHIDIRNWVWHNVDLKKVSPEKPAIVINDGDIITQDGKQFKVTLTQVIPQQKYNIGMVIDSRVIVDAEFKDNEWYYMVYYRNTKELVEFREIFINF